MIDALPSRQRGREIDRTCPQIRQHNLCVPLLATRTGSTGSGQNTQFRYHTNIIPCRRNACLGVMPYEVRA